MKQLLLFILVSGLQLVLASSFQLASANDATLDEAEALLDAIRARQSYAQTAEQFSALGVPNTISSQELQDRIYNEMARIYSEVYSETELQAMREFFESPVGQAFLDKKPNSLQFLSGSQLASEDDTNLDEAEALLNAIRARQTLEQIAGQSPVDSSASRTAESQDFYDDLYRGMVRAYAQAYTATELQEIREFFESSAGQAFLDKKPLLTERYLEVTRSILAEIQETTGTE